MSGKSMTGVAFLILGPIGALISIGLLVFAISHSPNIGLGEALMAGPNAWVFKQPIYGLMLALGWGMLFVSGLLTVLGILLLILGAKRSSGKTNGRPNWFHR